MATRAAKNGSNGTPTLRAAPNLAAVLGGGYTPLPKKIRQSKLRQSTKVVYNSLCSFFQMSEYTQAEGSWQRECAWPTHEEIAQDIGEAHPNTVANAIKELLQYNVIMRQRRGLGLPDLYWLVDPEDWGLPADNVPPARVTKNVTLDSQKTDVQSHKEPQAGVTVSVALEPQQTAGRGHKNSGSLYKDNKGRNNKESNNQDQQQENPRARARGAAADAAASPEPKERKLPARKTQRPVAEEDTHTPLQEPLPGTGTQPRPMKEEKSKSARGRGTKYPRAVLDEARRATGDEGDWATCEYLVRMRGFADASWPTYNWWKSTLGPLVETSGREAFSAFVSWLLSDDWCRANAAKIQPAKVAQEFDEWWSKPEPRPAVRGKPKAAPAKRDDGRVSNSIRDVQYLDVCVDCGAALGEPHYDFCTLLTKGILRPGTLVADEHMKNDWVINRLRERRSAS